MASAASLGAALVPRHRPKRRQGRALFPVAKTGPSEPAKVKKATKRSAEGLRVIDFADLIAHLGTLTRNTVRVPPRQSHRFTLQSTPTALQEAAFKLLDLDPARVQQTKNLTPTFSRRINSLRKSKVKTSG